MAHALKNNVRNVAVIGLANAYGDGFVKNFEHIATAKSLKIMASERYATTDTSVVGQVVRVLAAKPDAIRDGMEGLRDFVAAEGVYTMSDKDHNGVDARCQDRERRWNRVP